MKQRAYERIATEIEVQFVRSDIQYTATLKNISQNGMYIESPEPLPFHSRLDIHLPFKSRLKVLIDFKDTVLEVPVKVRRLAQDGSLFTGMGVVLTDTSESYLEFLKSLAP